MHGPNNTSDLCKGKLDYACFVDAIFLWQLFQSGHPSFPLGNLATAGIHFVVRMFLGKTILLLHSLCLYAWHIWAPTLHMQKICWILIRRDIALDQNRARVHFLSARCHFCTVYYLLWSTKIIDCMNGQKKYHSYYYNIHSTWIQVLFFSNFTWFFLKEFLHIIF